MFWGQKLNILMGQFCIIKTFANLLYQFRYWKNLAAFVYPSPNRCRIEFTLLLACQYVVNLMACESFITGLKKLLKLAWNVPEAIPIVVLSGNLFVIVILADPFVTTFIDLFDDSSTFKYVGHVIDASKLGVKVIGKCRRLKESSAVFIFFDEGLTEAFHCLFWIFCTLIRFLLPGGQIVHKKIIIEGLNSYIRWGTVRIKAWRGIGRGKKIGTHHDEIAHF